MIKNIITSLILLVLTTKTIAQTNTFPDSGDVGVGTTIPKTKLHVLNGTSIGIKTTYGDVLIEDVDSHLDLISSRDGTWGSAINLVEGKGGTNANVWSIARQTTHGDGNSGLQFNFGTKNQHNNVNIFSLSPIGNVGVGTTAPETKFHVQNGNSIGIKTKHSDVQIEDVDSQLDLISSKDGTWGSAINLVEGKDSSNANVWSIVRQTTNEVGDSGLRFNFGINNEHINTNIFTMLPSGNVGIGTTTPDSKLTVNGNIRAKEVKVEATNWPDYVFEEGYERRTLQELEHFILINGHMPGFKSAAEYEQEGVNMLELNQKLVEKVEELTLYLIEQEKTNQEQAKLLEAQQKIVEDLLKKIQN